MNKLRGNISWLAFVVGMFLVGVVVVWIIFSYDQASHDLDSTVCYDINTKNAKVIHTGTLSGCKKLVAHLINNEGWTLDKYVNHMATLKK